MDPSSAIQLTLSPDGTEQGLDGGVDFTGKLALSEVANFTVSVTALSMTDAAGAQRLQYQSR